MTLLIEGIDFIMGNDIPGCKVYQNPEYVSVPLSESDPVELEISHPDVFGAQARKKDEVILVEPLFATALSEDKLPPAFELENVKVSECTITVESGAS